MSDLQSLFFVRPERTKVAFVGKNYTASDFKAGAVVGVNRGKKIKEIYMISKQ